MKLINSTQRQKQIYSIVFKNFDQLSVDRHGYQVVQECILMATVDQSKNLIEAISAQL
jgi:hypothetical protein